MKYVSHARMWARIGTHAGMQMLQVCMEQGATQKYAHLKPTLGKRLSDALCPIGSTIGEGSFKDIVRWQVEVRCHAPICG